MFRAIKLAIAISLAIPNAASARGISLNNREFSILARTIQGEAGGETEAGQIAVAEVIFNRMTQWDEPLSHIVLAKGQFDVWSNKKLLRKISGNKKQFLHSKDIARKAISLYKNGHDISKGATFYCRKDKHPRWAKSMKQVAQIGAHKFFNAKVRKTA